MSFTRKRAAAAVAAATTALIGAAAPVAGASVKGVASPDINRVNCAYAGDPLQVLQSSTNVDCFENAGGESVKIYHIDEVFTGSVIRNPHIVVYLGRRLDILRNYATRRKG